MSKIPKRVLEDVDPRDAAAEADWGPPSREELLEEHDQKYERAIRTQVDGRQLEYSLDTGLDCSGSEDMARQEFAEESDINRIMQRYGAVAAPQRQVTYGEQDFSLDLHSAFIAMENARTAHASLPADLRKDYPTWQHLAGALERGEIRLVEKGQEQERTPPSTGGAESGSTTQTAESKTISEPNAPPPGKGKV